MIIKEVNYGLQITDQEKKNELAEMEIFILGSPGQSGHCSLLIVVMANSKNFFRRIC